MGIRPSDRRMRVFLEVMKLESQLLTDFHEIVEVVPDLKWYAFKIEGYWVVFKEKKREGSSTIKVLRVLNRRGMIKWLD